MRNLYTSIDIGTDTIKVIVCEYLNEKIHLLASSSNKSKGIKKGQIIDMGEALNTLKTSIVDVEEKLGIKIREVLTVVPSINAKFSLISGSSDIAGFVTKEDIISSLQKGVIEEKDMEMVTILPISFNLDGKMVLSPINMQGNRLETKAILVQTPSKNMYDILKLTQLANLDVIDISINGICDMCALKNSDIASKVGVIVNIGSELTNISLYNKGIIISNRVLEIGGKAIDNDLSYIFKTNMYDAKKLKEKFSIASLKYASISDIYDLAIENGKIIKVNQQEVTEVVSARLEEILRMIKSEINSMTNKELDYIIFTGGTSNIPYFEDLIKDVFKEPANIAKVNIIGLRNIKYTTVLGNVVYYLNKQKLIGEIKTMVEDNTLNSISSMKKSNVSNESVLEKVAGYFFGE